MKTAILYVETEREHRFDCLICEKEDVQYMNPIERDIDICVWGKCEEESRQTASVENF